MRDFSLNYYYYCMIFIFNINLLRGQRIVITGGPGFGKTSIIDELESRNFPCQHEVSRTIIKEQLEIGGDILPWKNLAVMIFLYKLCLLHGKCQQILI